MEPIVEGWDLVIKVKYGDMLKRFSASVRGNTMDHDMNKLRKKIIDLFKLNPYADVILSYVDEDGDDVSLDNDDELLDAVITQHLNPLRISVQLKYNIGTASEVKHYGLNSTFARQPQVEQQPLEISSTIDEALKSPSDPPSNGFHKDPLDFFTRALPPILPEFVDTFAKIGFNISQLASNSTGESSGTSGETTNKSNNASVPMSTPSADPLPVQLQRALSQAAVQFVSMAISTISQVPDNSTGELSGISEKEETKSTHLHPKEETKPSNISASLPTSSVGVPVRRRRQLKSVNLIPGGTGLRKTSFPDLNMDPCDYPIDYDDKSNDVNCCGKSVMPTAPLPMPSQKVDEQSKGGLESISAPRYGNGMEDQKSKMSTNTTVSSANPDFCFQGDATVNHHIGTAVPDLYIPSTLGLHLLGGSRRKHQGYSDRHTFHQVECDGCGMYPIIGPRFKSKVKEDYDLCSICFSQMGDEVDYTRIDKAHSLSSHKMFKGSNKLSRRKMYPHLHGTGAKFSRVELESCFVQDVTILDGTLMPPSTPFTKIWRMRNNGSIQWPYGTQLEWIGGDQFSKRLSVQLEIPVEGCQVDEEIDIAADFFSPPIPGSYISYWRLASPSGQKFGQRVWVLIQVDSSYSFSGNFNLNLPLEGSNADVLRVVNLNAGVPFEPYTVNSSDELVEAIADHIPVGNSNLEPFDSQLTVGNPNVQPSDNLVQSEIADVETFDSGIPCDIAHPDNKNVMGTTVPAESLLSSPLLDVPPVVHPLSYPLLDISLSPLEATVTTDAVLSETETNNAVEQALLKELEDMGFKHIDLNREILRKNDYNLEQSVDDLCGFTEWDLLLDELQEMGFCERSKNKKLLEKNSGSIKQVVLDLIAEENK